MTDQHASLEPGHQPGPRGRHTATDNTASDNTASDTGTGSESRADTSSALSPTTTEGRRHRTRAERRAHEQAQRTHRMAPLRTALAHLPRSRGLLAGAAAAVVVGVLTLAVWLTHSPTPDPAPQITSTVPAADTLSVGEVDVVPVGAPCPEPTAAQPCPLPVPPAPQVITAPAGELPIAAGDQVTFPGVSGYNVDDPGRAAPFTVRENHLRFTDVDPGTYRVTLIGSAGTTWQFTLVVTPS